MYLFLDVDGLYNAFRHFGLLGELNEKTGEWNSRIIFNDF